MPKISNIFARGVLGFFSLVFSVLSMPPVRDFLWKKMVGKGKEKIVDAEARVIAKDGMEKKVVKKKGLFR